LGYVHAREDAMQDADIEMLARRLEALERTNRSLRRLAALAIGVALAAGAFGTMRPAVAKDPVVVDCQKLRLLDSKDKVRGVLAIGNDDTPLLALLDADGKVRCVLTLDTNGYGNFSLNDQNNSPQLTLGTTDSGPAVVLQEKQKGSCISLASTNADTVISIKDNNARQRVSLGVEPSGTPQLRLLNEKGADVFKKP
jgi:hypothetical protein